METKNLTRKSGLKKLIIVIVIVLLVVALLLGIQIKKSFTGKVVKENLTMKVGIIFPLTGSVSFFGNEAKNGIDMAINDLKDVDVEAIYEDDKCDVKESISAYNKLVDIDGVNILIGPFCSSVALTLSPLAERDKVVMITPAAAAKNISYAGDYIFRNHVLITQKSGLVGRFASIFYKKGAILYDMSNDAFVDGADSFKKQFETGGNEIVAIETFKRGDTDFRSQISNIKSKSPEVLYIGGLSFEASLIFKQINELGLDVQIVSDDAVVDPSFLKSVGELSEGLIFSTTVFSKELNPGFWKDYSDRYGTEPSIFAAQAYDTLMILGKIVREKCRTADSTCIKNELYKIQDYPGVGGKTSFDENGDALKPLVLKTIRNGKIEVYKLG